MAYPVSSAFWSSSASWYSARKSAQAASAKNGVGRLAHKEQQWITKGSRYLRARQDLSSKTVRVDPRLTEDLLRLIDSMAPAVVAAFDAHLGRLAFEAWRQWPVGTGLSKSLIGLEYSLDGDRFVGEIVCTAPYVFFIKGQPHRELLDRPAVSVGARIAAQALAGMRTR